MRFTSISLALLVLARSVATGVYAAPAYADAQLHVADLPKRDLVSVVSTVLGTVTTLLDQILGEAPVPLSTDALQQIIQKLQQLGSAPGALPIGALPTGALPVRALPSTSSPGSLKPSVPMPMPTVSSTTTTPSHTAPVAAAQTSVTHSSMSSASHTSGHPSSPPRASTTSRMRRQSPPSLPLPTAILSTPLSIVKQGPPTPSASHSSSTTSSAKGSASATHTPV